MKKRIGAILLTICMLVGLLPTAALAVESCDGSHDLVLKYNETMHWVECNNGGLTCLSDYYGEEISDPSQITDDMLRNGVLDVYYDQHPEDINDYRMWQELLGSVAHTYYGGTTCVLCHYDKTAGSGSTEGDSSDSEGDTGSEGSGSGTGESDSGDSGSGDSDSGDSGDSGSGDSGNSGEETVEKCTVTFSYTYPAGAEANTCTMYAEYTADGETVTAYSGDTIPANTSVKYRITDIATGYRIKSVTMNDVDWTDGFIDGGYGYLAKKLSEDTTVNVIFEEIPDPLPTVTGVTIYQGYAEDGVVAEDVTFIGATEYEDKRLTAAAAFDTGDLPTYHAGYDWYYSADGVNYTAVQGWGTRNDFRADVQDYVSVDLGFDFINAECYYIKALAVAKDYYSQTPTEVWSEPIPINHSWDSGTTVDGQTTYTCSGCDATRTETDSGSTGSGSTEETTGYKLTLNYDADQCSVKVTDKTANTEVANGGYVTIGTYGASMDIWVYVTDGYRIENVEFVDSKGTQDLTEHYIIGAYGWDPTLYAYSDCTLTITTDAIPSNLPTVTGVELYSDAARTEAMSSDVTLADGEYDVVYAKATYADGGSYPNYTARGTLEYTVDGVTWKEGVYGDGQIDFQLNSYADEYYDTGVKYPQYDYRIRLDPDNMYCTGGSVYSEVYHVNGGVGACNHSWDEGSVTTAATCTEDGVKTYTCSQCGETKTETIAATGHTEVTDAAVAATCTATGLTEGKHCSVCDTVLTAQETVAALGHKWSTNNCAEAASCTRDNCDETREAGTHAWGDWTVTDEASCIEDGSQTRTCASCGETETEAITKLDHDYDDVVTAPTCTEGGYTTWTCTRCGDSYTDSETAALDHDWDEGVITTQPTEDAEGVKTYTCQRTDCGATKTESVSKLAKQEVSWFPAGPITWTYGQVVSAQNTAYNDTADGGALTYTSSDENVATVDEYGKAKIVGAGTVQITATAAAVPGKYAETSASYTLIINKAPLTVTASDASITYGQAPANTGWTATGFVYDDNTADVTGTASYTYGYEQFGTAGSYDINVSGLSADNYEITYAPGTLTVNKAADYTITLGNLSQRDDAVTAVTASIAPQDATAEIKVEYLVNDAWTDTVPAEAGEYQVRASLTSSDNIVTDGAYTTGTLTVERSIVVDDTDVSVTVEGEKAEIVVTDEELTEIVNNADGEVSIDLSGVTGVTELTVPGTLMDALAESEQTDGLTISTGDASITMSAPVLDTVADAVTGEDTVTVKLTAVSDEDLNADQQAALNSITQDAVIVEVSLVITHADGSTTELHQLGGNVEVTVPYAGEVPEGKYIVVCYLSDDGNVTYVRATYDAEKKQVTFNTNHFSNYAIFVSGDPTAVVDGGSGSGLYAEGSTVTIKADSKSGYTFAGWEIVAGTVTLADSKKAETTFVMPGEAVELKATYRKNSSSSGGGGGATYAISVEDAKHGEVNADSKTFAKGETVTLTVNPDTGYTLETLTVTDKNGKEIELTKKDGKYTFTMPAGKVTVKATFMEDNSMLNFFVDVPADAYYYDAVLWAAENEITGGTSATTFSPDMTCTRAQAVTFLWRAAGSPAPESEIMPFADVSADAYYYDAVLWAVEQGITAGTSETTFSPDMKCTRAQIVTFLWRAQKTPSAETVNPFTDVANDAYYADAVIWAVEQGITAGTSADTFSPNANCTRAQIVTFLWRCMGE
ncbi:MAG: S-layer homology domain-containing protein [Oscillibacter sp.]|nr:S-layer homology domain-containing protein [Oscillibacter sp.]